MSESIKFPRTEADVAAEANATEHAAEGKWEPYALPIGGGDPESITQEAKAEQAGVHINVEQPNEAGQPVEVKTFVNQN